MATEHDRLPGATPAPAPVAAEPVHPDKPAVGRRARPASRWTRALEIGLSVAAGALGLKLGYDFGTRLAGLWLGLIMGFNAALFCALVSSFATNRIFGRSVPPEDGDAGPG